MNQLPTVFAGVEPASRQWQIPPAALEIIPRELVRMVVARRTPAAAAPDESEPEAGQGETHQYDARVRIAAVQALVALQKQNQAIQAQEPDTDERPKSIEEIEAELAGLVREIAAAELSDADRGEQARLGGPPTG